MILDLTILSIDIVMNKKCHALLMLKMLSLVLKPMNASDGKNGNKSKCHLS